MNTVSPSQTERSRKIESTILRAIAEVGQSEIARLTNVSESTVSRRKEDHIGQMAELLAAAGLKVVPVEYRCIDPKIAEAWMLIFDAYMKKMNNPLSLLLGDE
ncbi:MAG: CII family transcriptional regulator [Polynucleobacter sp.]